VAGTLIYLKTAEWLLLNLPQLGQAAGISTQFLAASAF
jgi:magnesium transporter